MIPGLKAMTERSAELGVRDVIVGMAHRGRLNVLTNVMGKPREVVFSEFKGSEHDIPSDNIADWSASGELMLAQYAAHATPVPPHDGDDTRPPPPARNRTSAG